MYIALLDHARNEPRIGSAFSKIAAEYGSEIRAYEDGLDSLKEFLVKAEAFICLNDNFIRDPSIAQVVREELAAGKRLLARVSENALSGLNAFLEAYHIEGTRMRLAATNGVGTGHQRLISLDRMANPESFRDASLLMGVGRLVIAQPNLLRYGGDARPLVVLPMDDLQLVDAEVDLREAWASSEATCIAAYETVLSQPTVVAIAGDLINDPYVGATGFSWPGISAGDNAQFGRNLVSWLTGRENPDVTPW